MPNLFAHSELKRKRPVPKFGNDFINHVPHNGTMVKRYPENRPEWFVAEWLEYLDLKQTYLVEQMGRSKGRVSELVNGRQRFNMDDLRKVSKALGIARGFLLDVNPLTAEGRRIAEQGRLPSPPMPHPSKRKLNIVQK